MSEVLDFWRKKDTNFLAVPDEKLARFIGERHPEFLQDPAFKREFETVTKPKPISDEAPTITTVPQGVPSEMQPSQPEARTIKGVAKEVYESITRPLSGGKIGKSIGIDAQTIADVVDTIATYSQTIPHPGKPAISYEEARKQLGDIKRDPVMAEKILAGAQQAVVESFDFFTSPLGMAALGTSALPKLAQKAVALGFVVDMGRHIPEQLTQLNEAVKTGDPEQISKSVTGLALTGTFMYQGGRHTLKGLPAEAKGILDQLKTKFAGTDEIPKVEIKPTPPPVITFPGPESPEFKIVNPPTEAPAIAPGSPAKASEVVGEGNVPKAPSEMAEVAKEFGLTEKGYKDLSTSNLDVVPTPEAYKGGVEVKQSNIEGQGSFAARDFQLGEKIGPAIVVRNGVQYRTDTYGRFTNHSKTPNADLELQSDGSVFLRAKQGIKAGEELTADYRQMVEIKKQTAELATTGKLPTKAGDIHGEEMQGQKGQVTPQPERTAGETPSPAAPAILAPPVIEGMGAARYGEVEAKPKIQPSSIKNAEMDATLKELGKPGLQETLGKPDSKLLADTMAKIDNEPGWQDLIIEKFKQDPSLPHTDMEALALDHRLVELRTEHTKALIDAAKAFDEGRIDDASLANQRAQIWSDKVQELSEITKATGRELGRALRARQLMMNDDFSISHMVNLKRAANGWRKLTEEEVSDINKTHKEFTDKSKELDEHTEAAAGKAIDDAIGNARNQNAKTKSVWRSVADRIAAAEAAIRKRILQGEQDLIYNKVQELVRALVEQNPAITRAQLTDQILVFLRTLMPISRLEVMDLISGRGRFTLPSSDVISKIVRDLKTQTRLVAHQIDIMFKRPLPKTGVQRDKLSDIARREEQRLNNLKRRFGVTFTDPAHQLASLLSARKTYYRNRMADLAYEIDTLQKTVRQKALTPADDAELKAMKSEYEKLKAEHDSIFNNKELTEEQRLELAERATTREITELERQLATGEIFPKSKQSLTVSSTKLESLKAVLEELKAERYWARDLLQPKPDMELAALASRRAYLTKLIADYQRRVAEGDYQPKTRKGPLDISEDSRAMMLTGELEAIKRRFQRGLMIDQAKRRTIAAKVYSGIKEVINIPRSVWSAFDISAVGRQGGWIGAGHPTRASRSLNPMLKGLVSERQALAEEQAILNRPNAARYARSKLYLASLDEFRLTKQEEIMMSRYSNLIPGVRGSNRAFMTYLNKLRADSFDAMSATIERWSKGKLTPKEDEAISNYINIATGRGNLGAAAGAAEALATAFWSPRLVASRFQLLFGQPLYHGTARTRALIALEYAQSLSGLLLMVGLGGLIGGTIETDSRSSDFMKLKFGNTRVDLFGGLIQNTVLLSRFLSGKTIDIKGKEKPAPSSATVINYLRNKLTPAIGLGMDARDILLGQKPPAGHPQTMKELLLTIPQPLSIRFQDIYDIMLEHGVPSAVAFQILNMTGIGVQNYQEKEKGSTTNK